MSLIELSVPEECGPTAEESHLVRGILFKNTTETIDAFDKSALYEGFLGFNQYSGGFFVRRWIHVWG